MGHSAFDFVGDDPTPHTHLCLEKTNHESDVVDTKTLEVLLQNSGVRLMVMTSFASAAPTPDEDMQTIGPFNGVAQTLIAGISGVNAVVVSKRLGHARVSITEDTNGHLIPGMQVEAAKLISDLVTLVQLFPIVPEAPSEAQNATENER